MQASSQNKSQKQLQISSCVHVGVFDCVNVCVCVGVTASTALVETQSPVCCASVPQSA